MPTWEDLDRSISGNDLGGTQGRTGTAWQASQVGRRALYNTVRITQTVHEAFEQTSCAYTRDACGHYIAIAHTVPMGHKAVTPALLSCRGSFGAIDVTSDVTSRVGEKIGFLS